jgi:hypothetical protein
MRADRTVDGNLADLAQSAGRPQQRLGWKLCVQSVKAPQKLDDKTVLLLLWLFRSKQIVVRNAQNNNNIQSGSHAWKKGSIDAEFVRIEQAMIIWPTLHSRLEDHSDVWAGNGVCKA